MKHKLIEFPLTMFTYNKSSKTLVREASDMGNRHLQSLYDDACDIGFAVKSSSGVVIIFCMGSVVRNDDGEIIMWKYFPTTESVAKLDNEHKDLKAVVFND